MMLKELAANLLLVSLTTSAVIALLFCLSPLLDRRYTAKWRYWVWMLLAARLLIPWNLALPEAPVTIPVAPPASAAASPKTAAWAGPAGAPGAHPIPEPAAPAPVTPDAASRPAAPAAPDYAGLAAAVWLAGAGGLLLWQFAGYALFLRQVRRWSAPESDPETVALLRRLRDGMGVSSAIRLLVCKRISSPMMTGFFRPALLLPDTAYGPDDLELILRHELVHFRRRDIWYKLLLALACAAHWFNPLVWLMARAANRDIELACDSEVVRGCPLAFRRRYGETILAAIHAGQGSRTVFSTYFHGGAKTVRRRLRGILDLRARKRGILAFAAVAAAAAAVGGCVVFGGAPTPEECLERFSQSIRYDPESTELSFTIPEKLPAGERFYLKISGRDPASSRVNPDGSAWRLYESETEDFGWEAGKTYASPIDTPMLWDGLLEFGLTKGRGEPVSPLWEARFFPDGRTLLLTAEESKAFYVQANKHCLTDGEADLLRREGWSDGQIVSVSARQRLEALDGEPCSVHTGLYHVIDPHLVRFVGQGKMDAFLDAYGNGFEANIVNFVRFCGIPKEDFSRIVAENGLDAVQGLDGHGYDADVIYSGDDARIQAYYTEPADGGAPDQGLNDLERQTVTALQNHLASEMPNTQLFMKRRQAGGWSYVTCLLFDSGADFGRLRDPMEGAMGYINLIPGERFSEYAPLEPSETEIASPVEGLRLTAFYREGGDTENVEGMRALTGGEKRLDAALRLPPLLLMLRPEVEIFAAGNTTEPLYPVTDTYEPGYFAWEMSRDARPLRAGPLDPAGEPPYRLVNYYLFDGRQYVRASLHFYEGQNRLGLVMSDGTSAAYTFADGDNWPADLLSGLEQRAAEQPAKTPPDARSLQARLAGLAEDPGTSFYLNPARDADYLHGSLYSLSRAARARRMLAQIQVGEPVPDGGYRLFRELSEISLTGSSNHPRTNQRIALLKDDEERAYLRLMDFSEETGTVYNCFTLPDPAPLEELTGFLARANSDFQEKREVVQTDSDDPAEIGRLLADAYFGAYVDEDLDPAYRLNGFEATGSELVKGDSDAFCVKVTCNLSVPGSHFTTPAFSYWEPGDHTGAQFYLLGRREGDGRYRTIEIQEHDFSDQMEALLEASGPAPAAIPDGWTPVPS